MGMQKMIARKARRLGWLDQAALLLAVSKEISPAHQRTIRLDELDWPARQGRHEDAPGYDNGGVIV